MRKGILIFGFSSETHRVTSPQRLFNVIELKLNERQIMQPLHFGTFPIRLERLTPFAKNARIGGLVVLDRSPSSQIHLARLVNEQLFRFHQPINQDFPVSALVLKLTCESSSFPLLMELWSG